MNRAIVCVATTPRYQRGMARLESHQTNSAKELHRYEPFGSPSHAQVPYAFKAYALEGARRDGFDLLLWADACIRPVKSLEPLWQRIERDGYWFSKNGFTNYEWTADSAYEDIFAAEYGVYGGAPFGDVEMRGINREIPHVVATSFGINVKHPIGKAFLDEYFRLASQTKAFCGPWTNANNPVCAPLPRYDGIRVAPCGPSDVRGHRHDQTAASVIAWRLGMVLTNPPDIFSYPNPDGSFSEQTILLADGGY